MKENKFISFLVSFPLGKHKWCTASVTLREGTGKVTIRSPSVNTSINDILYFTRIMHRYIFSSLLKKMFRLNICSSDQLIYPFKVIDRVNLFDIDVVYDGVGFTAQAIATRLAISKALCSFISSKEVEYLRLGLLFFFLVFEHNQRKSSLFFLYVSAGLLTDDGRRKERKQPGRRNARRKYKLYVRFFIQFRHKNKRFVLFVFLLVANVKLVFGLLFSLFSKKFSLRKRKEKLRFNEKIPT